MAGHFKFDFFVKDWFLKTRDLSQGAKGVYIDLLAAIYARGGPLPNIEADLCAVTGCRTVRSLRPLLAELIQKNKLQIVDGQLVNGRAEEELAKADVRFAARSAGGKARSRGIRAEYDGNTTGTQPESHHEIMENQCVDQCLSPSPSPSPNKEYRFLGKVIRLTDLDLSSWEQTYHAIPDLKAELSGLDDWWDGKHPVGDPERTKWWHPIRGMLNKKHQRSLSDRQTQTTGPNRSYPRGITPMHPGAGG